MIEHDFRLILNEELLKARDKIIANIQASGQVASEQTIRSLVVKIAENSGSLWGRRAFETLETGRKAGSTPKNFVEIIQQWMQDKGIQATPRPYTRKPSGHWQPKYTPEQRGNISMAGAIAWSIKTKGSSLYRSGGRSDIFSNVIPDLLEQVGKRISGIAVQEVEHITLNNK